MSSPRTYGNVTTINVLSNFSNSRSPEEYPVDVSTTAGDLVKAVLARHSMLSKDPQLLYVTLDTIGSRGFVESVELDENSRLLQRLRNARMTSKATLSHVFVMHMRSGGLLKIHDSCIMPGSFYNSLYVSMETNTMQVIGLLLASYGSRESANNFQLVAKDAKGRQVRQLLPGEFPLAVQQQQHQPRPGGELSIHLKRVSESSRSPADQWQQSRKQSSNDIAAEASSGEAEVLSRSETLARLQASFKELQRLREKNPELYDKLLVAGQPTNTSESNQGKQPLHTKQSNARPLPEQKKSTAPSRGFLSARQHSIRLGSSSRQPIRTGFGGKANDATSGSMSARTTKSNHTERCRNIEADYWFAGEIDARLHGDEPFNTSVEDVGFLNRQLRANRSARGELQQSRLQQPQRQQPQALANQQIAKPAKQSSTLKRQLPQLPHQSGDPELRARRLQIEQAAQRQLKLSSSGVDKPIVDTRQRDAQSQTSFPVVDDAFRHDEAKLSYHQPSLREILAICETHSCQLSRRSLAQPWGLRWREVQFGDVNGNHRDETTSAGLTKPAIGRRQGAFQRNERLLKYMRTLVAIEAVNNTDGEIFNFNGVKIQSGDLVIEVNGCLATGLSPDQLDSLIESQLTLDLLLARQPGNVSIATGGTSECCETELEGIDKDNSERDLRLRLRRLQLQYNELASQCRVHEQVIQRLRNQLTKTARVCLLQHTDTRPKSHTESERSFKVINAMRESPVTSAV